MTEKLGFGGTFGKQVCRLHPQCSNQIGQYAIVMPPILRYWVVGHSTKRYRNTFRQEL